MFKLDKKLKSIVVIVVLVFIFLLIYQRHMDYGLPFHIDEWHHITEGLRISSGDIEKINIEIGFHLFLALISKFVNLVLVYKFLPAIWGVLSALVLFYVTHKKTNNYWLALGTIVFFASIKSNVNLLGPWFFTPLTFATPFIFLYFYFFTEGVYRQSIKFILWSLAIMLFLIPVHAISVLFALPVFVIYLLVNFDFVKKNWQWFLAFFSIPLLGWWFYNLVPTGTTGNLLNILQFSHGWGVVELNNSLTEVYSPIGYFLAIIGVVGLAVKTRDFNKYLAYILWPAILVIWIISYKLTGVSYLVPFQRNFYYLAIGLPFLSAFGVYYAIISVKKWILWQWLQYLVVIIIVLAVGFFTFVSYDIMHKDLDVYRLINDGDYEDLVYMSQFEPATVMARLTFSTTMYPVSGHRPVGTIMFYGGKKVVNQFFRLDDCQRKEEILKRKNAKYVVALEDQGCGWEVIRDTYNYIYDVSDIYE